MGPHRFLKRLRRQLRSRRQFLFHVLILRCLLLGQLVVCIHVQPMSNMEAWHIAHTRRWRKHVVFARQEGACLRYRCREEPMTRPPKVLSYPGQAFSNRLCSWQSACSTMLATAF